MRRLMPFSLLLILLTSCQVFSIQLATVTPTTYEVISTFPPPPTETPQPTSPVASDTPIPLEPEVESYNFLLLGGDYREHRTGTSYGDKTDVMLLVMIHMTDPVQITVIQFPRNFYHPVRSFDDMWLFHVYGREDFTGLHYYFQQVFDVDLNGIAYISMDNFVAFVDDLGGVYVKQGVLDGEGTLKYLRDNDNNWGCSYYDCNGRQFVVLRALAEKVKTRFREDPLATARMFWDAYRGLFKTDLSEFEQFHWLVELGWIIATSEYQISFDRVTMSGAIEYGDTPLEVRGWIVTDFDRLQNWFTFGG